ncbi:helix-turn-helix domain-containing protein [bacterium]|nr:MAG: helix-turn-helix domain-containing protein [bacterium]
MEKDLLRVDEVAAMFHVKPRTVRRWIKSNRLVIVRNPAGRPMIMRAEVYRFLSLNNGT